MEVLLVLVHNSVVEDCQSRTSDPVADPADCHNAVLELELDYCILGHCTAGHCSLRCCGRLSLDAQRSMMHGGGLEGVGFEEEVGVEVVALCLVVEDLNS